MPQFQLLPAQPGFGEQLGQALGGGISQTISAKLQQHLEQQKTEGLLKSLGLGIPSAGQDLSVKGISPGQKPPISKTQQITPQAVLAANVVDPQGIGKAVTALYESQEKSYEKERAYQSERSNKYLDKISTLATNLDERRIAIESAKAAVQSGEMRPFGGDFVADVLNLPQLRTASGAQLATAAKTNLIGSLSQVTGGRPNQFIEQQISNAFAKAGQTEKANLAQLSIIETKLNIDEKLAQATDELADQYRQELGYVPESIDRDVRRIVKPYADQKMKELAYDLRENIESEMGVNKLKELKKVPTGTPLTLKTAKILVDKYGDKAEEVAIKLGYEIPEPEVYSRKK